MYSPIVIYWRSEVAVFVSALFRQPNTILVRFQAIRQSRSTARAGRSATHYLLLQPAFLVASRFF
jgi:hypothetical protein